MPAVPSQAWTAPRNTTVAGTSMAMENVESSAGPSGTVIVCPYVAVLGTPNELIMSVASAVKSRFHTLAAVAAPAAARTSAETMVVIAVLRLGSRGMSGGPSRWAGSGCADKASGFRPQPDSASAAQARRRFAPQATIANRIASTTPPTSFTGKAGPITSTRRATSAIQKGG